MWKKGGVFRKAMIILFLCLIGLTAGGGLNKAFADQDIQSRLTDWFDNRKNESISEMDRAITLEKNRLMDQLRIELQLEMKRAQVQLAQHTANVTAEQISELQKYAAELSAGINVSTDAEKKEVSANISTALEEAKLLLQKSAVAPNLPEVPKVEKVPEAGQDKATQESSSSKPAETPKSESSLPPSDSTDVIEEPVTPPVISSEVSKTTEASSDDVEE
ncbi:hypothetical protein [Sporosarcina aquimarina]|uniref:Uncharacterized protein n=1 Tax=Sporosarcina aquimarina TaxID=114975 RepID=A0ABU4FVF0_9BACL|nr:hypothetical protein [Sporosarcina aquimarina]MDW0108703.1 hypothetical protein [Sporosarcina aquimarina]